MRIHLKKDRKRKRQSQIVSQKIYTFLSKKHSAEFKGLEHMTTFTKGFGKSGWKVNGSRLFGSYRRNSESSGTSGKVFPYGMLLTEIRVPSLKSHVWYQFQAFAAVFRYTKLICTNGKHTFGTKFTNPEFYLPFTQNVKRPVWQVNGRQPIIFSTHYLTSQGDSSRHCLLDGFTHYNSVFTN